MAVDPVSDAGDRHARDRYAPGWRPFLMAPGRDDYLNFVRQDWRTPGAAAAIVTEHWPVSDAILRLIRGHDVEAR